MTPDQCAKSGSEHGEQVALFCWLNSREVREQFPQLYNSENGKCKVISTYQNFTDAVKGARAKAAGISSGVADIFLPLPRAGVHGLWIELKINPDNPNNKGKKGKLSQEQREFSRQVIADGYGWAKAEGWQEAAELIRSYLQSP